MYLAVTYRWAETLRLCERRSEVSLIQKSRLKKEIRRLCSRHSAATGFSGVESTKGFLALLRQDGECRIPLDNALRVDSRPLQSTESVKGSNCWAVFRV